MPILKPQDKQALKTRLRKEMKREITINLFTLRSAGLLFLPGRECPSCPQMHELLEEITELSPSLNLEYFDFFTQPEEAQNQGVDRIPCLTFQAGEQKYQNIKYYGVPSGYEFAAFLEVLISMSRNVSPLQLPTRKALRRLDKEVIIKVFVTPG
jgi:hypothetical protein